MWSLAHFKQGFLFSVLGFCLMMAGSILPAHAQSLPVSIGASVIKSDFSSSTASMVDTQNGTYLVTFHIKNSGELTSDDTMLSLVLPTGWGYKATSGTVERILVQDRAYGQLLELSLAPFGKYQTRDVSVFMVKTATAEDGTFFAAITSRYSSPMYSKLTPEDGSDKQSFWSSWLRSVYQYVSMTMGEIWSRFIRSIRYTSS